MKQLDRIIHWISWVTILVLAGEACAVRFGVNILPPHPVCRFSFPILVAAAVGYLTNRIAITLLFKPYEPVCGFQGVIPRNQARIGRELGSIIPEYLLSPEDFVMKIGALANTYLADPAMHEEIRQKLLLLCRRRPDALATLIQRPLDTALTQLLETLLSTEKLVTFAKNLPLGPDSAICRRWAMFFSQELRSRTPELTPLLRQELQNGAVAYLQTGHPALSSWLPAEKMMSAVLDQLDWRRIESRLNDRLGSEEFRRLIAGELAAIPSHWEPRAGELAELLREMLKPALQGALSPALQDCANKVLEDPVLFGKLAADAVEPAQAFLLHKLKKEKRELARQFDFSGRIESSVAAMDMPLLHKVILRVSGEHLVALQLMGYVLGACAGTLLSLLG